MQDNTYPFPKSASMCFCIGAQKAGTTWLYKNLVKSDETHFCKNKELHYFTADAGVDYYSFKNRMKMTRTLTEKLVLSDGRINRIPLEQLQNLVDLLSIYVQKPGNHGPYYKYLLSDYVDQKVVFDITPAYALLKAEQFADMAQTGEAKFIFIMRDPVDRMWSQIRMAVSAANKGKEIDFDEECAKRAQYLITSGELLNNGRFNYKQTIAELEAAVPAERIKLVFYENLFKQGTMDDICDFLGLSHIPIDIKTRNNPGRKSSIPDDLKRELCEAFDAQYEFVSTRFKDEMPAAWQQTLDHCKEIAMEAKQRKLGSHDNGV